jgi:fluoride exporter
MSIATWAGVAVLGGAGAVARFVVDGAVAGRFDRDLPVGTLAVNLSGAFLLGLVAGLALTGDVLLLVGTATLGSYTTFSTWMLETQRLVEDGEGRAAGINIVLSLAAGLTAVALGRALG